MYKQAQYLKEGDRIQESGHTISIERVLVTLVPARVYMEGTYEATGKPFKHESVHQDSWWQI